MGGRHTNKSATVAELWAVVIDRWADARRPLLLHGASGRREGLFLRLLEV
jgi:hypothetical protein